jgi:hypothetical protein
MIFKLMFSMFSKFAFAATVASAPFPIFLKSGFSSVLEFEETPTRIVLGDPQSFQVEKLNQSIVVRPLVGYATSNLFVYFKSSPPKLILLSASEDAEPTFYKKFESLIPKVVVPPAPSRKLPSIRESKLLSSQFDKKKDYLVIEIQISADSNSKMLPEWNLVRANFGSTYVVPSKLWSERTEVQKDSKVKARFIFTKPNFPKNLNGVTLVIPIKGQAKPFVLSMAGSAR